MQETWVRFLGWEDALEKGMATHSQYSCLENTMDRAAWRVTVLGVTRVRHDLATKPPPPPAWCPAEGWAIQFAGQATEGSLYIYKPPRVAAH